jgi:hypothetical protein
MLEPEKTRYIARAPRVAVEPATLTRLAEFCAAGDRTLLLGYNDYAKHLVNLFGTRIVGVIDVSGRYEGIEFRGVPVLSPSDWRECDQVLVCDHSQLLFFKRMFFTRCTQEKIAFRFADTYGTESMKVVDFAVQDPLYRTILHGSDQRPPSMLSEPGVFALLELLRSCLALDGEVADVGAWQGGSAWYMARLLALHGSDKKLFVFDKGEELGPDNPQGIVGDQQMARDLAFYPAATVLFGNVVHTMRDLDAELFAFVFLDFGWVESIVDFFYQRLAVGGIMLLDNYGHTLGHPDEFDAYFERHGATVVRQYRSPVGFVVKR